MSLKPTAGRSNTSATWRDTARAGERALRCPRPWSRLCHDHNHLVAHLRVQAQGPKDAVEGLAQGFILGRCGDVCLGVDRASLAAAGIEDKVLPGLTLKVLRELLQRRTAQLEACLLCQKFLVPPGPGLLELGGRP